MELEKEMEALQGGPDGSKLDVTSPSASHNHKKKGKKGHDEDKKEEEEIVGPKPMLPYSSMFIFSPTNS